MKITTHPSLLLLLVTMLSVSIGVGAQSFSSSESSDTEQESFGQFDCLINASVNGLVSCLPAMDGDVREYRWDMGDGTEYQRDLDTPYIYHQYSKPGEYTVTLTVSGNELHATSRNVLAVP